MKKEKVKEEMRLSGGEDLKSGKDKKKRKHDGAADSHSEPEKKKKSKKERKQHVDEVPVESGGVSTADVSGKVIMKKKKKSKLDDVGDKASGESALNVSSKRESKKALKKGETFVEGNDETVVGDVGTDSSLNQKKDSKSRKKHKQVESVELETDCDKSDEVSSSKKPKKKKKVTKSEAKTTTDDSGSRIDRALEYLQKWHSDRCSWKFEKVKQMVLLSSMYDQKKLPEEDFEVLLLYLEGLVGKAKEKTLDEAEKKLNLLDEASEGVNEEEYERVRRVIQVLS